MQFLKAIKNIKGILFALLLLFLVELLLHHDGLLQKYRSVFAAGRLMDKISYINNNTPGVIIIGNSRVDNGIDPSVAKDNVGTSSIDIFNLGIPGSNTRVIQGVLNYIIEGNSDELAIKSVLIGLDPGLFTLEEQLGYSVFFGNRKEMWAQRDFKWLLASEIRLWGFSTNLKGLREPDKLMKFVKVTFGEVIEAWGGDVLTNKGFRAEKGVLSLKDQQDKNHFDQMFALDERALNYFIQTINYLQSKGVKVAVFYPLVYRKQGVIPVSDLFKPDDIQFITDFLKKKKVRIIRDIQVDNYNANDFFNPGHFNSAGAEKFTRDLIVRHFK